MNYDPVLKDLVELKSEDYFPLQRLKFWKAYAEYLQVDIDPIWYSKDSFKIPMVDLDLYRGKQFTSIYEPSLAASIKRDIRNKFISTQTQIDRYLDGIEKGSERLNFLKRIQTELKMLLEQIKSTEDINYSDVIRTTFEFQSKELFHITKSKIVIDNPTGTAPAEIDNSSMYYKFFEEDEGKEAIEDFCVRLRRSGWIEDTSILNLKKIFSDRPVSKKVTWKGGINEFVYLFQELKNRELVNFGNIWKASSKNFLLLKKDGTAYTNKELKNAEELRNNKKRIRIDALIEILDIER